MSVESMSVAFPNRRTLVKGAAWAAPLTAVASVAPAVAASRCEPVNAKLTAQWGGLTPGVRWLTDEWVTPRPPWWRRSYSWNDTRSVKTHVRYRNDGPDVIPAGTFYTTVSLISQPGKKDASAATPYAKMNVSFDNSADWTFVGTEVVEGPALAGGYTVKWYQASYVYNLDLLNGQTTSRIHLDAIPTVPRPGRSKYGSNWPRITSEGYDVERSNFGHAFYTYPSMVTCNEHTGDTEWKELSPTNSLAWGVAFGLNPDGSYNAWGSRAASTLTDEDSIEEPLGGTAFDHFSKKPSR